MSLKPKSLLPHGIVFILFVAVSLVYFYPVLQGKTIYQADIVQYTGMAKERNDYRTTEQKESYWTNSAFGGMPTYQLGAQYEHHYIKKLDKILRFLPRPTDYLFLYFIGFYVLIFTLLKDYRLAFLGALAFGFSTYLIIIFGAGHNAKAHAIAYMPWVLAGLFWVFQKKYFAGFIFSALAMGLEIAANHYQMTYYLGLLILIIGVVYLIEAVKQKQLPHFAKSVGILSVAYLIGLGINATPLMATQEYAAESTRGKSELTINSDGTPRENDGLSKAYITEYSYGITESFNLFIPRFMGGGSAENVGTDSAMNEFFTQMGIPLTQRKEYLKALPTYWGEQPIVAAPAYIGAVIFWLAIAALFLLKGKHRRWLVAGSVLALLLSWGKNFGFLTDWFIDYFPLYNKFRAVSSIQVIIELCMPVLAMFALYKLFSEKVLPEEKKKAFLYAAGILAGVCLIFLLFGRSFFRFSGSSDAYYIQQYGIDFVNALKEDRASFFVKDTLRSLLFVILGTTVVWLHLKQKIDRKFVISLFAVLVLADLAGVDKRYVNANNFVNKSKIEHPFSATAADTDILKDDGHFRVYDLTVNPFSSARANFFHQAVGGYHAAKPRHIQDLYDFYLEKGNREVFNMLNVKYFIVPEEKEVFASLNDSANGNAWFVEQIKFVKTADEEILGLGEVNTRKTALLRSDFQSQIPENRFVVDSAAVVKLIEAKPDYLYYETENNNEGFVVFSEIYYPHGWIAYVNENPEPHFRTNYALRGMYLPAGYNKIEFRFNPQVVEKGSTLTLAATALFILLVIGGFFVNRRKKSNSTE